MRLYNPLPIRVAVNLTVDGLNSITGKPSGIAEGEKWLLDPYTTVTIRGWQVSDGEARRFFFTDKPKSYAKWSGDRTQKDLSVNCGVIGAAYFWSQKELDRYNDEHPTFRSNWTHPYPAQCARAKSTMGASINGALADRVSAPAVRDQLAGTGMGEREPHPTTLVDYHYDTGMYQLSQAVVIYYDFAAVSLPPNPFPAISFAPEMP